VAFFSCCLGALGLEQEKAAFSVWCPGALGLEGLEQEEESLIYEGLKQAVACLK
jgi:hypothetical protein